MRNVDLFEVFSGPERQNLERIWKKGKRVSHKTRFPTGTLIIHYTLQTSASFTRQYSCSRSCSAWKERRKSLLRVSGTKCEKRRVWHHLAVTKRRNLLRRKTSTLKLCANHRLQLIEIKPQIQLSCKRIIQFLTYQPNYTSPLGVNVPSERNPVMVRLWGQWEIPGDRAGGQCLVWPVSLRNIQGKSLFFTACLFCRDVLQRDSTNADAVYVRALCLYYDDNIDKAVNFFIHSLKLSPDLTKARLTLKVANHFTLHDLVLRDLFPRKRLLDYGLRNAGADSVFCYISTVYQTKQILIVVQKAKALSAKKAQGNEAYKSGKHQEALDIYEEALQIDENNIKTNAKLRYNKALVSSKVFCNLWILTLVTS